MHLTLCTSLYALHSMHFTLCISFYALHSMHLTLCTSLYVLNSVPALRSPAPASPRSKGPCNPACQRWGLLSVAVQRAVARTALGVWTMPALPTSPASLMSLSSPISRGAAACRFGETCVHRGGVGTWITTAARGGGKKKKKKNSMHFSSAWKNPSRCLREKAATSRARDRSHRSVEYRGAVIRAAVRAVEAGLAFAARRPHEDARPDTAKVDEVLANSARLPRARIAWPDRCPLLHGLPAAAGHATCGWPGVGAVLMDGINEREKIVLLRRVDFKTTFLSSEESTTPEKQQHFC